MDAGVKQQPPATHQQVLGGAVGKHCVELLRRDDGFDPIIVTTTAPTRVILTVLTALLTVLGLPEPTRQVVFGSIIVVVAAAYTRVTSES